MPDPQQFEAFMGKYQNMVFSTAMRLLANPVEAEDVTQEVFLKAYERFADLSKSPTAGGWLKTVTTNLCLNHLSRYRSRWSFFSELFHGSQEEGDAIEPEFPAAQRVPLVLYHMECLPYEQIAERLGVSLGKVKTDIFRGRDALRKKLRF